MEVSMSTNQILVIIMLICIVLIIIGYIFNKPEVIIKLIVRCALGIIAIYFTNEFLGIKDINTGVGINLFTGTTVGLLGAPGYALLYALAFVLK